MRWKIFLVLTLGLIIVPSALADTLWSNGTPTSSQNWCNSDCSNWMTGATEGFVDFDNFRLDSASQVTGFSLVSKFSWQSSYSFTTWYLWTSKPDTPSSITALVYGDIVGQVTRTGNANTELLRLSTPIALGPGTYWLGFRNHMVGGTSSQYQSTTSPLPGGAGQLIITNPRYIGDRPEFAFTVEGFVQPDAVVPEPASITLLCGGLASFAGLWRRRRRNEH